MGNIGFSFGVWTQTPTHSQPEHFLLQVPWVCSSKHCSVSPEAGPLLRCCILIWSLSPKGPYHSGRRLQKVTRIHTGFCGLDLSKMNMLFQLRIKEIIRWGSHVLSFSKVNGKTSYGMRKVFTPAFGINKGVPVASWGQLCSAELTAEYLE